MASQIKRVYHKYNMGSDWWLYYINHTAHSNARDPFYQYCLTQIIACLK